jgi:RHS repeat-associated protein
MLVTETNEAGTLIKDYIWNGMTPVAQIEKAAETETIIYLYTDHLMTNRLATNSTQAIVWRWEGEAFGNTPAKELAGVSVNLRFPGQYYDQETNLHYNWNRYYDPNLGRYITSDPIGLQGGVNTYIYALVNPVIFTDPSGLRIPYPGRRYEKLRGPFGPVCGAEGTAQATWIPDGPWKDACQKHDDCYAICGIPKLYCDMEFLINSDNVIYYTAVYRFADSAYDRAQEKACEEDGDC